MTNHLLEKEVEAQKYIVFTDGTARVFPKTSIHSWQTGGKDVLSAGFCKWNGVTVQAYGESTTLGVKSRGIEDAKILYDVLKSPNQTQP